MNALRASARAIAPCAVALAACAGPSRAAPAAAAARPPERAAAPASPQRSAIEEGDLDVEPFDAAASPRPRVQPTGFRLDTLPRVRDLPALTTFAERGATAPGATTVGALPGELAQEVGLFFPDNHDPWREEFGVRVTLTEGRMGRIRVGELEGSVDGDGAGGVFVACASPRAASPGLLPAPVRWDAVKPSGAAGVRMPTSALYERGDGWFDPIRCEVRRVHRVETLLPALPGTVLLAYREACEPGAPAAAPHDATCDPDALHLIAPPPDIVESTALGGRITVAAGPLTRVVVPVSRGQAASLRLRIDRRALERWVVAAPELGDEIATGVEVVAPVGDDAPTAIAYAAPL